RLRRRFYRCSPAPGPYHPASRVDEGASQDHFSEVTEALHIRSPKRRRGAVHACWRCAFEPAYGFASFISVASSWLIQQTLASSTARQIAPACPFATRSG